MSLHCKKHKSKVDVGDCLEDRRIINEPEMSCLNISETDWIK
jgi:hypothetical protein